MKLIRAFLIGTIVISAYLLFLQWQFDYGTASSRPPVNGKLSSSSQQSTDPKVNPEQAVAPAQLALPAGPATERSASDIILSTTENSLVNPENKLSSLITVETDNIIAHLDLNGGDIVYLALRDFKKELKSQEPLILLNNQYFTYVAQSGLIGTDGIDNQQQRPRYQADKTGYVLAKDQDKIEVKLSYQAPNGLLVHKIYTFQRTSHLINLRYSIQNTSDQNKSINLFGQIKHDGLEHYDKAHAFGIKPYLGGALTTEKNNYQKIKFASIKKENLQEQLQGGWIALVQHYFIGAWIPDPEDTYLYQTRFVPDTGLNQTTTNHTSNENYILGFVGPEKIIAAHQELSVNADFYAGPKHQKVLQSISKHLDLTVDYGWLWFISQPLFWLLEWIHSYIGNWGWSIVLLTLFIKLCFFHLSATSYKSMAKMRQLGPKLIKLREQYAGDKQAFSKEMMAIYKREKINPLSGCLPIVVQMPVFIALYWTLLESVELRHSPFIFWIKDLSVMDPYFILPILMGISMFLQQQLSPAPIADPIQAKVMKSLPIIFTIFFLWFPAGLVLYWLVNNMLSIAQQWVITRQIDKQAKKSPA